MSRTMLLSFCAMAALSPSLARASDENQPDIGVYESVTPASTAPLAAPVDNGTVTASVRAALNHNPALRGAGASLDAAKAERFRAFGGFLPNIQASATYTDDNWNSAPLPGQTPQDGATLGVTAVQPVFQGLSSFNRFRAARSRASQAELSLVAAQQDTVLDAARAHAGVVLARAVVAHRIENMGLVSQQLLIARKRQEAGAQSRTGVEQARMRLAQAQVDLGQARATLAEREAAYERITGRKPPEMLAQDTSAIADHFTSLDNALMIARKANPLIAAAESAVKAARHSKSAAVGDFAPKVTVEGSYFNRTGNDAILPGFEDEYQVVARMTMPIFRQGNEIASLRSANAAVSQEEARMTQTVLSVEETVMRSWRQLGEAQMRAAAAKTGIEAAQMAVKGLQMEYDAGQRTIIDVLDGQRDLVVAQISQSQAEYELLVSQYELAAAAGVILDAFSLAVN